MDGFSGHLNMLQYGKLSQVNVLHYYFPGLMNVNLGCLGAYLRTLSGHTEISNCVTLDNLVTLLVLFLLQLPEQYRLMSQAPEKRKKHKKHKKDGKDNSVHENQGLFKMHQM